MNRREDVGREKAADGTGLISDPFLVAMSTICDSSPCSWRSVAQKEDDLLNHCLAEQIVVLRGGHGEEDDMQSSFFKAPIPTSTRTSRRNSESISDLAWEDSFSQQLPKSDSPWSLNRSALESTVVGGEGISTTFIKRTSWTSSSKRFASNLRVTLESKTCSPVRSKSFHQTRQKDQQEELQTHLEEPHFTLLKENMPLQSADRGVSEPPLEGSSPKKFEVDKTDELMRSPIIQQHHLVALIRSPIDSEVDRQVTKQFGEEKGGVEPRESTTSKSFSLLLNSSGNQERLRSVEFQISAITLDTCLLNDSLSSSTTFSSTHSLVKPPEESEMRFETVQQKRRPKPQSTAGRPIRAPQTGPSPKHHSMPDSAAADTSTTLMKDSFHSVDVTPSRPKRQSSATRIPTRRCGPDHRFDTLKCTSQILKETCHTTRVSNRNGGRSNEDEMSVTSFSLSPNSRSRDGAGSSFERNCNIHRNIPCPVIERRETIDGAPVSFSSVSSTSSQGAPSYLSPPHPIPTTPGSSDYSPSPPMRHESVERKCDDSSSMMMGGEAIDRLADSDIKTMMDKTFPITEAISISKSTTVKSYSPVLSLQQHCSSGALTNALVAVKLDAEKRFGQPYSSRRSYEGLLDYSKNSISLWSKNSATATTAAVEKCGRSLIEYNQHGGILRRRSFDSLPIPTARGYIASIGHGLADASEVAFKTIRPCISSIPRRRHSDASNRQPSIAADCKTTISNESATKNELDIVQKDACSVKSSGTCSSMPCELPPIKPERIPSHGRGNRSEKTINMKQVTRKKMASPPSIPIRKPSYNFCDSEVDQQLESPDALVVEK